MQHVGWMRGGKKKERKKVEQTLDSGLWTPCFSSFFLFSFQAKKKKVDLFRSGRSVSIHLRKPLAKNFGSSTLSRCSGSHLWIIFRKMQGKKDGKKHKISTTHRWELSPWAGPVSPQCPLHNATRESSSVRPMLYVFPSNSLHSMRRCEIH